MAVRKYDLKFLVHAYPSSTGSDSRNWRDDMRPISPRGFGGYRRGRGGRGRGGVRGRGRGRDFGPEGFVGGCKCLMWHGQRLIRIPSGIILFSYFVILTSSI